MIFKRKDGNVKRKQEILSRSKSSFSQCGEDLIVEYIFRLRGIELPSYIDIGANDPFYLNNTALFYEKGCRGINIEANPKLINALNKYRPEDKNLNLGIGSTEEELIFYIVNDHTLSSFSKKEIEVITSTGKYKVEEVIKIKVLTVEHVLSKYWKDDFPDFLTLDAEGMDLEILKSIRFSIHRPKVMCVEAAEYSKIGAGKRRRDLIDYITSQNYYEYANTNLNAILVDKDFWFI
ncbi:FkbM family methyltransferase [Flavisolibacter sp. BT320]|nr:FkbM family methyltransferase [Flavisolibacter longurius]